MSGITPLLDTLLHQVLGRRVDIPVPRDLNQPVAPALPVDGARAAHSDSRLDARVQGQAPLAAQSQAGPSTRGVVTAAESALRQSAAPAVTASSASTVITLSAAARDIADLLQRYPSPQAAIRPAAPLLPPATSDGAPAPQQISSQLRGSIEHSGLFYESHVSRWVRGELPLEVLRREPQMQVSGHAAERTASAAPTSGAASVTGGAPSASPVSVLSAESLVKSPVDARVAAPVGELELEAQGVESVEFEDAGNVARPESLAVTVRHQLEMLAVPQLRWEGQVWAGLFMALTIEAPPDWEGAAGDGADDAADDSAAEWRLHLDLQLAGAGALAADIRLRGESLALALQSDVPVLQEYFQCTQVALRQRLLECGFARVDVRMDDGGVA